jgi:hypothetical protein
MQYRVHQRIGDNNDCTRKNTLDFAVRNDACTRTAWPVGIV